MKTRGARTTRGVCLLLSLVATGAACAQGDPLGSSDNIVSRFLKQRIVTSPRVEMGGFHEITTISGQTYAGNVFWSGRNALLIKGEGFETIVPVTALCERDFKVFGFQENRASDGKFWHDRKTALEAERGAPTRSLDDIEAGLAGLEIVGEVIARYERRLESQDPTVGELERFIQVLNAAVLLSPDQWFTAESVADEFRAVAEVVGSPEARRNQDQTGKLESLVQSAKEKILLILTPSQRELWHAKRAPDAQPDGPPGAS